VRSLTLYAGVRVSPTGHVRFQDQGSKNLTDLVLPPSSQYLSFSGGCYTFINDRLIFEAVRASPAFYNVLIGLPTPMVTGAASCSGSVE